MPPVLSQRSSKFEKRHPTIDTILQVNPSRSTLPGLEEDPNNVGYGLKANTDMLRMHLKSLDADSATYTRLTKKHKKERFIDLLKVFAHQKEKHQRNKLSIGETNPDKESSNSPSKSYQLATSITSNHPNSKRYLELPSKIVKRFEKLNNLASKHLPQATMKRSLKRKSTIVSFAGISTSQEGNQEPNLQKSGEILPNFLPLPSSGRLENGQSEEHSHIDKLSNSKGFTDSIKLENSHHRKQNFHDLDKHETETSTREGQYHRVAISRSSLLDMKEMIVNVGLLHAVLNASDVEFIKILKLITKNNPWCDVISKILKSGKEIKEANFQHVTIDQRLRLNLPLICVDLKEYLIDRRVSQLERSKVRYLSESVNYMDSCKKFQSFAVKENLQKVLKDQEALEQFPNFDVAKGESIKLLQTNFNRRLPNIVKASEASRTFKLESVNDYWKEANYMVAESLEQLIFPRLGRKEEKSKEVKKLSQEFEKARHLNSVISYQR